jgi:uncharacterized membrane protein
MRKIVNFFKTTILGGILVVLPAWVAVLLLVKVLIHLEVFVKPVSSHLPPTIAHPILVAIAVMILACFLVGLGIRTSIGNQAKTLVERKVLEKVPGYVMIRNVAEQMSDLERDHGFKPALVEMNEGLAPCFIVEEHTDGRCTIFLPSSPTPTAGSVLIIAGAKVHALDVPVTTMFGCISKWGTGSAKLLEAMVAKKS